VETTAVDDHTSRRSRKRHLPTTPTHRFIACVPRKRIAGGNVQSLSNFNSQSVNSDAARDACDLLIFLAAGRSDESVSRVFEFVAVAVCLSRQ
jgi:hypothetical protein